MTSFIGRNSINNLSEILKEENAKNILVFTGKKSFDVIKTIIEKELIACDITYYNNFSTNPKKEEIDVAIEELESNFDIIIAIGGGSVIDFAKAYRYYTKPLKLIAIPTTCGTGSEATQFAVIYIEGVKHSLDEPSILPDYAIIDSQFVENNPKYLKACTAMDAYCQAIESYWAVGSTEESRKYARQAIILCRDNLVKYVNSNNPMTAENMALASYLAGKAINISKTTAAHALSYKITSKYGIPHGHAVALSIAGLFEINTQITSITNQDPRGVNFVKKRIDEIKELIQDTTNDYFYNLLTKINLEIDLQKLKITDKTLIINSVNTQRLNNNPRSLTKNDLNFILTHKENINARY